VYFASLAGSYIARIDSGAARQRLSNHDAAPRRKADLVGLERLLVVSEWNAGQLSRYDPATHSWRIWRLPGKAPKAYAVYVDSQDKIWLSDFAANAVLRFDPTTENFQAFPSSHPDANIRQLAGRSGEVWGAESGADHLVVFRTLLLGR